MPTTYRSRNIKTKSAVLKDLSVNQRKFNHYFRDVRHLRGVDPYRVADLFNVTHPALQHALKKILCTGARGSKDAATDVQEAIDSLNRWLEMKDEDSLRQTEVEE